jgi:hypothetical protein
MVCPSRPYATKTPGTDYSGEHSERKTETKLLTEKEKTLHKPVPGPTRGGSMELNEVVKVLV